MSRQLRVAMIGYGFMGATHSQGWRVAPRFFDLPAEPVMQVVVGRNEDAVGAAARKWGWAEHATDWREVIARDDIDVVDVVTSGDSHAEIAIAALEAGKHVLCEKPLANTVAEAEAMVAAAARAGAAGTQSMVGFTYRRVPAVAYARSLIADGRIGTVRQIRASYRQDWLMDAEAPLTWRLQKERAGSGSLGDIGVHAVDLAEHLTGLQLTAVAGVLETIVTERPLMGESIGLSGTASTERGEVTVDDLAIFTGRFADPAGGAGALGSFEATRFATGRKNALRIEISGSAGALAFDLERMNQLEFHDATVPPLEQGFRTILVTEHDHPYLAPWWPPGHMLGYEHAFSNQVHDFVNAVVTGEPATPSFAEGLHLQKVLEAVQQSSAADAAWRPVD